MIRVVLLGLTVVLPAASGRQIVLFDLPRQRPSLLVVHVRLMWEL